jgi:hypothetical protein
MLVSEALMSAKTFAGFPHDRIVAIPTSDATRSKILALRSSNELRSSGSSASPERKRGKGWSNVKSSFIGIGCASSYLLFWR